MTYSGERKSGVWERTIVSGKLLPNLESHIWPSRFSLKFRILHLKHLKFLIFSGVSTTEILIYDSMFLAVIALMQFVEIAIIAFVIFNVECQGNFFNVFLLLYLQSLSGVLEGNFWPEQS